MAGFSQDRDLYERSSVKVGYIGICAASSTKSTSTVSNASVRDHSHAVGLLRRHTALNLLKREPTKIPLKRKRLKAAINPEFRTKLLAVNDS